MSNQDSRHHVTTATCTVLLEGLKDPNNEAVWRDYVGRYRPLIVNYAQRFDIAGADAEDIAQQTLAAFATAYQAGHYEREKGRLRTWLFGIARNHILNWCRRGRPREVAVGGRDDHTDFFEKVGGENQLEALWNEEWHDAVLRQCLLLVRGEVKEHTYEAFVLFAVEGKPAQEVAERLKITQNAVFGAKRRILRRIRELQPQMDTWY